MTYLLDFRIWHQRMIIFFRCLIGSEYLSRCEKMYQSLAPSPTFRWILFFSPQQRTLLAAISINWFQVCWTLSQPELHALFNLIAT